MRVTTETTNLKPAQLLTVLTQNPHIKGLVEGKMYPFPGIQTIYFSLLSYTRCTSSLKKKLQSIGTGKKTKHFQEIKQSTEPASYITQILKFSDREFKLRALWERWKICNIR